MRVTVLVENETSAPNLRTEHGLALWIETGGRALLFDTGASDAVVANAAALGVDLSSADAIVISHGHYDHAGGLAFAARASPDAAILAGPNATMRRYSRREDGIHEIGFDQQTIRAVAHRLKTVRDGQRIVPGVAVLAEFPDNLPLPEDNRRLLVRGKDGLVEDPFTDEIALLVDTGMGPVLITGCSHRGIGNIVQRAGAEGNRLAAIIGGFHLRRETDERIMELVPTLERLGRIYGAHCTGAHAIDLLRSRIGTNVSDVHAGAIIDVG